MTSRSADFCGRLLFEVLRARESCTLTTFGSNRAASWCSCRTKWLGAPVRSDSTVWVTNFPKGGFPAPPFTIIIWVVDRWYRGLCHEVIRLDFSRCLRRHGRRGRG